MYKKYAYSYFVITANKFCENLVNIFLCLCFLKIFVGFLITLLQDKIIKYNVHRAHKKICLNTGFIQKIATLLKGFSRILQGPHSIFKDHLPRV